MNESILDSKTDSTNVRVKNIRQTLFHLFFESLWRCTPGFTKQIVKRLFFAPARYAVGPAETDLLKRSRAFEIYVNNARIKCWKWGRGPAVLLSHGWNGRGIQFHRFIQPLTEAGYAVLAFDGPGHGESDGKTSSYFEYSDVIRYFFRSAGEYQIKGVIAHSFGAAAVINAMVKESFAVPAVLIAPALKLNEILGKMFYSYGVPETVFRDLIKEYEERFAYNLQADDPIKLLKKVKSRIVIVHDKRDETIAFNDSLEASRISSLVSLHPTQGLGHKRILYDPQTVGYIVENITGKIKALSFQADLHPGEDNAVPSIGELVEEYRAGDFERKLSLYLECPALREKFIKIDQGYTGSRKAVAVFK